MPVPKRHKNLGRLSTIWIENPVYFITICTIDRKAFLNTPEMHEILSDEWKSAKERHGWYVGRYVVMPDHVHFFCAGASNCKSTSSFIGSWKEWTSKRAHQKLWQENFFDHVLRSNESYGQKAHYMEQNPVRAGLVSKSEDWPYHGDLNPL